MARYNALPADGQSRLLGDGDNWYVRGAPDSYAADPRFIIPYTNSAPAPYPAPLTVVNDPYLDSDGDGMSDILESAVGRDPHRAADLAFEFNTAGDFEGWDGKIQLGVEDYVTNAAVTGGMLSGENLDGNRGQFERYGFSFDGSEVSNMLVRVGSPNASGLIFRWATTEQNIFAQERTLIVNYTAGKTNPVVIPVGTSTQWTGQVITQMRLNPANVPAPFAVDWIRASEGDYDEDGFPDEEEETAGTDPVQPGDFFRISGRPVVNGDVVSIRLEGRDGRSYTLMQSTDLVSNVWNPVDTQIASEDGSFILMDTSNAETAVYKVNVEKK
jgi:hypothetical protein